MGKGIQCWGFSQAQENVIMWGEILCLAELNEAVNSAGASEVTYKVAFLINVAVLGLVPFLMILRYSLSTN